jgi:N-terminal domain of reverse transcriptase
MTALLDDADAASTNSVDWRAINWAKCQEVVRRLQVRIAKAVREEVAHSGWG